MDILKSSKELSMAELNYTNWDIFLNFFYFMAQSKNSLPFLFTQKKETVILLEMLLNLLIWKKARLDLNNQN